MHLVSLVWHISREEINSSVRELFMKYENRDFLNDLPIKTETDPTETRSEMLVDEAYFDIIGKQEQLNVLYPKPPIAKVSEIGNKRYFFFNKMQIMLAKSKFKKTTKIAKDLHAS